uniref:Uncharacterized protein n=1 Tax=Anguilla anguilla TaxID=7936 RepID=A0A0E9SJE0_ANGAN
MQEDQCARRILVRILVRARGVVSLLLTGLSGMNSVITFV